MADDRTLTLADLDARSRERAALRDMTLRTLSTTKPLDGVLDHYDATEMQERACYALLTTRWYA